MYVADICYTASIARLRVCTALRNVPGFPERLPFGLGSVLVVPRRNGGENSLRKSASPCPCCVLPLSHPAQPARPALHYYYAPLYCLLPQSLSLLHLLPLSQPHTSQAMAATQEGLRQRVQSTVQEGQQPISAAQDEHISTFTPPAFTVKDLLGECPASGVVARLSLYSYSCSRSGGDLATFHRLFSSSFENECSSLRDYTIQCSTVHYADVLARLSPLCSPASTGAIPKHCFERSALRSGSYLVGDLLMLAAFAYLASFIDGIFGKNGSVLDGFVGQSARVAAWAVYCFCAGSVGTGVWIIAHECECL